MCLSNTEEARVAASGEPQGCEGVNQESKIYLVYVHTYNSYFHYNLYDVNEV